LPGLTRQSIPLNKKFLFLMDARVKPAHDAQRIRLAALDIQHAAVGVQHGFLHHL
jgi:hypothetical protein